MFDNNFKELTRYFVSERIEHVITRERTQEYKEAQKNISEVLKRLKKYAPDNFIDDIDILEDSFAIIEVNHMQEVYRQGVKNGGKMILDLLQGGSNE